MSFRLVRSPDAPKITTAHAFPGSPMYFSYTVPSVFSVMMSLLRSAPGQFHESFVRASRLWSLSRPFWG
jgi:hypothetical protein